MDKPRVSSACDAAEEPDPVQLEIFHLHFASIAEEMGVALENSAVSTNVRERLDFSCAVFDSDGGLVANAPHIPVHLGARGACVRQVSRRVSDLAPGDVIVTNDPFLGGSHLPDVTVVTPVFDAETAELLFYTASRAHHAEIGGRRRRWGPGGPRRRGPGLGAGVPAGPGAGVLAPVIIFRFK